MSRDGFYGSDINLFLPIDKIYSSYADALENVRVDEIFLGRYILIKYDYPEAKNYEDNKKKDNKNGYWHLSIMRKSLNSDDSLTYIRVGSLNLSMLADPNDTKINFNSEGLNKEVSTVVAATPPRIDIKLNSDGDKDGASMSQLTFNIPELGNAIAQMWDVVFDRESKNSNKRKTDLSRAGAYENKSYSAETLAGCLGHCQRLLGYHCFYTSLDGSTIDTAKSYSNSHGQATAYFWNANDGKVYRIKGNSTELLFTYALTESGSGAGAMAAMCEAIVNFNVMLEDRRNAANQMINDRREAANQMINDRREAVNSVISTADQKIGEMNNILAGVGRGVNVGATAQIGQPATQSEIFNSYGGDVPNTATGIASHAEGQNTTASHNRAHAEGYGTTASGQDSHAEGHSTIAEGQGAHAEGRITTASGGGSHAEGSNTKAIGNVSHAEGYFTETEGANSHAEGYITSIFIFKDDTQNIPSTGGHSEGYQTIAIGKGAHAEGYSTTRLKKENLLDSLNEEYKFGEAYLGEHRFRTPYSLAYGDGNHVEGIDNFAVHSKGSHAEGFQNNVVGNYSHAEGQSVSVWGESSHAEGYDTYVGGNYSHAEGNKTKVYGDNSHAEGDKTNVYGDNSHAEGKNTTALGENSHIEGSSNTFVLSYIKKEDGTYKENADICETWKSNKFSLARGLGCHVEGFNCLGLGNFCHVEGENNQATGTQSHAEGQNTKATEEASHAEGVGTQASAVASHAEGRSTVASGSGSHAEGGISVSIDGNNTIEYKGTTASGIGAHSEGAGTTASGVNSHAEGYGTEASQSYSHAEGWDTRAWGKHSHAEGYQSQSRGDGAHSEGATSLARGPYSHAEGLNSKTGDLSDTKKGEAAHAEGYNTLAYGNYSHAEGFCEKDISITTGAYGKGSHIEGQNTYAFGIASHSEGYRSNAQGNYSHAEGQETFVLQECDGGHAEGYQTINNYGNYCHTEGVSTETGYNGKTTGLLFQVVAAHAEGYDTGVYGNYSHAEGYQTVVANGSSHIEGGSTNKATDRLGYQGLWESIRDNTEVVNIWKNNKFSLSRGNYSHVEGQDCLALGTTAHAEGKETIARGTCSHAGGHNTVAYNYQTVVGYYNQDNPDRAPSIGTNADDLIFIVGNGHNDGYRVNAFSVGSDSNCHAGSTAIPGNWTTNNADFAEYFEWKDGNLLDEDRRGLFVTLEGDKIRLANLNDDYILGAISSTGAFIGNFAKTEWQGKYLKDVFGETLTKEIEVPAEIITERKESINEETGEIIFEDVEIEKIPAHIINQPIINPDYDQNKDYISRKDRSEWAVVGLCGQVVVVDDGTCEVNGYCYPGQNGVGTKSDKGYRVMKRLDDTHIKVLIK